MKQELIFFITCIATHNIIEDNIHYNDIQSALDRAVDSQRLLGLYTNRTSFVLGSKLSALDIKKELVYADGEETQYNVGE